MENILVSELRSAEWTPKIGDIVENFGTIGRIIEIRPAPYGDWILREVISTRKGRKWTANPAKCHPVM